MNLIELKDKVVCAINYAQECNIDPREVEVNLQIELPNNECIFTQGEIELHYDNNGQVSGCVLIGDEFSQCYKEVKNSVKDSKMSEFKLYRRKGLSEMRPYIKGENLDGKISVSPTDNPETDMGMVARNPNNHADQWYVSRRYFEENLEPVDSTNTSK
jgi:hypothetical protein